MPFSRADLVLVLGWLSYISSLTRVVCGVRARLIELGMQLKKPVVVILFTTSPKNGPWMPKADAVIAANYPQNGGAAAIADTLLGKISPAMEEEPRQGNCRYKETPRSSRPPSSRRR